MSEIKEIISIQKNISFENMSQVIYRNNENNIITGFLSGEQIWNFYQNNNLLDTMELDSFLHFSQYCNDTELIETKKQVIIEKIKKDSICKKLDGNIDLIKIKHENPVFTFTRKMNRKSCRLVTNYVKLNEINMDIGEYTFCLDNDFNRNIYFVSVKIIDTDGKLIDYDKIDKLVFSDDKMNISTWYGQGLLKEEDFRLDNLFPLQSKKYYFTIETEFKIKEVYVSICFELSEFKPVFETLELLDLEFDRIYYDEINEEIELEGVKGYFKELRFCLIDNITGKKLDCDLIERISIENLVKDIPSDLLKKKDNILTFCYGEGIIYFDDMANSSGFTLENFKVQIKFSSKIYNMNVREIKLAIFGKKHVYFNLKSIDNSLNLNIDV